MAAKTLSKEAVLLAVAEEKLGFSFGKPDRPSEKSLACILPILRETTFVRQYVTMPETENVLVTDSGMINKINIKNTGKENVFLRSGTIFEGKGTQSRIITRSAVLFPGSEVALDARCVHASHGIRTGSNFKYSGTVPMDVENASYTAGFTPADQHTVWSNVTRTTTAMNAMLGGKRVSADISGRIPGVRHTFTSSHGMFGASISTPQEEQGEQERSWPGFAQDNLKKNFDEFAENFDDILSKARLHDNQCGLSLITDTGCKTIELFDVPLSWESLHKDAVKRMGTELLRGEDKTSVFEYKPEHAVNAVKKVLTMDFKANMIYEHKPANGEPHVAIFGLTSKQYVGEVVEMSGQMIHLTILEMA
jgi:hypothetical protein